MTLKFNRSIVAMSTVFVLLLSGFTASTSWAAPSYPSAAEVEAAKKNVTKKKAMIARLDTIIGDLSEEESRLTEISQRKAETYNQAQVKVDEIAAKVDVLQGQADSANAKAEEAQNQLGQIAAQMHRTGALGTSLNLFLNGGKADDLLYKLGTQERIAESSQTLYQRSIQTQKYAQSLSDQLSVAKEELASEAAVAKKAYDEAQSAANVLINKVNENKSLMTRFVGQLASLRKTSAELERQRAEGLARDRAQQQGSADLTAPSLYEVGAPDSDKVETAIAFARKQLGEWYVLGGMGPNVWDCSGITKASYAAAGIYIGTHSATNQFREMARQQKLIPLKDAVRGDLMWYSSESAFDGDKAHVVIYLGNDLMLEAPHPGSQVRIKQVRRGWELFRYAGRPSA